MIRVEHLNFAYPGVDDTPGVSVFVDLELLATQHPVCYPEERLNCRTYN